MKGKTAFFHLVESVPEIGILIYVSSGFEPPDALAKINTNLTFCEMTTNLNTY
jgi:hypothetical protein